MKITVFRCKGCMATISVKYGYDEEERVKEAHATDVYHKECLPEKIDKKIFVA